MIFDLYWSWYEDYNQHLIEHPSKTKKEFIEDSKKALKEVGEEYLKQEDSWAGISDWMSAAYLKLLKIGYKKVKVTSWGLFGGYILDKDSLTEGYDDVEKFKNIVGDKLYKQAIKHNEKLEREIHEK